MTSLILRKHQKNLINALQFGKAVEPTRKEKFYDWLIKCGNVHTADNNKMNKAFAKIIEY